MVFAKIILFVVLIFFLIDDSTQFLVANCVWDDALAGVQNSDLKGFVLSDSDACALFCSKTGGVVVTASTDTQSATSRPDAALCDRCCKSSHPPSKPGELLVNILQTLIKAFGPTKTASTQTDSPTLGAGGSKAPLAGKPAAEQPNPPPPPPPPAPKPTKQPTTKPDNDDDDDYAMFDPGDSAVIVPNEERYKAAQFVYHDTNNQDLEPNPSTREPRQDRAYPEARIFEITERDDGTAFSDGFERGIDRGPGWQHSGANVALKSGTIR